MRAGGRHRCVPSTAQTRSGQASGVGAHRGVAGPIGGEPTRPEQPLAMVDDLDGGRQLVGIHSDDDVLHVLLPPGLDPMWTARWALLLRAGQSLLEPRLVTVIGGLQTDSEPHQNSRWAAAWRAARRTPETESGQTSVLPESSSSRVCGPGAWSERRCPQHANLRPCCLVKNPVEAASATGATTRRRGDLPVRTESVSAVPAAGSNRAGNPGGGAHGGRPPPTGGGVAGRPSPAPLSGRSAPPARARRRDPAEC